MKAISNIMTGEPVSSSARLLEAIYYLLLLLMLIFCKPSDSGPADKSGNEKLKNSLPLIK